MFSPSTNPCVVKVKATPVKGVKKYRYDPYRANVVASSPLLAARSPAKTFVAPPPAPVVPPTARAPTVLPVAPTPYSYFAPQQLTPIGATAPVASAATGAAAAPTATAELMCQCGCNQPMSSVHSSPFLTPVPSAAPSVAPSAVPSRSQSPVPMVPSVGSAAVIPPRPSSGDAASACGSATGSADEEAAAKPHFAIVRFKHDAYPYIAPFRVEVGDYVVVSGDRGENLGVVKSITTDKPRRPVGCRVLRLARSDEVRALEALRAKELSAVSVVRKAVKELGLNMLIVDTEYQLDESKLTIFFDSKVAVDFRRLQRVLFREFRCRVWIVNWKGDLPAGVQHEC